MVLSSFIFLVIFVKLQPPWEAGFSDVFHNVFLDLFAVRTDSFLKLVQVTGLSCIHFAYYIAPNKNKITMCKVRGDRIPFERITLTNSKYSKFMQRLQVNFNCKGSRVTACTSEEKQSKQSGKPNHKLRSLSFMIRNFYSV